MQRIPLNNITPLSEFRNNVTNYLKQVKETKRPIVITQHGKSAAVLLDADEYEALQESIELIQAVNRGEADIAAGKVLGHEKAKKYVLKKVKECMSNGPSKP